MFIICILAPSDRAHLHERIALRLIQMLEEGFVEEVRRLYPTRRSYPELPSIRSVGYRQVWDYLAGLSSEVEMREKAIAATRQLAKRQMTWLRSWPDATWLDADSADVFERVVGWIRRLLP